MCLTSHRLLGHLKEFDYTCEKNIKKPAVILSLGVDAVPYRELEFSPYVIDWNQLLNTIVSLPFIVVGRSSEKDTSVFDWVISRNYQSGRMS
ncbi:hypothetical protein L6164_033584 [Bauhinia variegata]|uniref:Uncharacterized protein n=1 Tax=Bauhinia variegata TaxID=167791 RepID=A0ACB9KS88_BAUVA|nr:hypothetical protein L6164_033584 [Bauhinia variegata]